MTYDDTVDDARRLVAEVERLREARAVWSSQWSTNTRPVVGRAEEGRAALLNPQEDTQ